MVDEFDLPIKADLHASSGSASQAGQSGTVSDTTLVKQCFFSMVPGAM